MKTPSLFIVSVLTGAFFLSAAWVESQTAQPTPTPDLPKTSLEALQAIKKQNDTTISNQKKTLETLDQMIKTSEQIKAFTGRS